jgi:hypothetical protein
MRKDSNFQTESLAFIAKVRIVNYYNENRWFNGTYSTLNARFTVNGGGLSKKDKKTLRSLLFFSIENLRSYSYSAGDYDKWFFELAKRITDNYSELSFGHAQKLINILMKYHFVYFYSDYRGVHNSFFIVLLTNNLMSSSGRDP